MGLNEGVWSDEQVMGVVNDEVRGSGQMRSWGIGRDHLINGSTPSPRTNLLTNIPLLGMSTVKVINGSAADGTCG